ncbi:hypothetical protein RYZ26_00595 [Terasakiella sp. A23]|uniref:hypothetical protein n=1 Tax=Terasakiella sp. FCG-A23 TaxID=3080561 RepID=UPI0029553F65|nr:hypothetical protein [Terasakiella sp. A23]MDV7338072.1 hypothetical protein [Terasakiella sp. A23]
MARSDAHMTTVTKLGFLIGWLFFGLAFLLAAAESALGRGFITSTNDLLVAMMGAKWITFKAHYASALFDGVVLTLLQLPGWLLAGLPAGFLLWRCRPHREEIDPDLYSSLTTYDRLAELAEEEGAEDDDPTFDEYDMADYEDNDAKEDVRPAKEYMKNWHPHDEDEEINTPARPLTPDEKMQKARDNLSIPFDKLS